MRIAFSECAPEPDTYLAPYQVWAVLEPGETPATALAAGFLVSGSDLTHFFLARSIRVELAAFTSTTRTRTIGRRCATIRSSLVPVEEFEFTSRRRALADTYLSERLLGAFAFSRFEELLCSPITTHVLCFVDDATGRDVGLVLVHLDAPGQAAYYRLAVYDPAYLEASLGYHMMSTALFAFREAGMRYGYLGSCYSTNDLYKTRFRGMQFFNGTRWSADRSELHFLIDRQYANDRTHLLEYPAYRDTYLKNGLAGAITAVYPV